MKYSTQSKVIFLIQVLGPFVAIGIAYLMSR